MSRLGELPRPTLEQRVRSLHFFDLMRVARELAKRPAGDEVSNEACLAVLDELETRLTRETFDAFVAEIYGASNP